MSDINDDLFTILKKHALDLWGVINSEDPLSKEEEQFQLDNVTWEAINKIKELFEL